MKPTFERFSDPNDLVGFEVAEGLDEDLIEILAHAVYETRWTCASEEEWSRPSGRAELVLRTLYGSKLDGASTIERCTAIFRFFLLDLLTGFDRIRLSTLEEFESRSDLWTPPRTTCLGQLWILISQAEDILSELGISELPFRGQTEKQVLLQILEERFADDYGRN